MKRNLQDDLDAMIYLLSKGKSYNDYWRYYNFKFLNTNLHSYHAYVSSLIKMLECDKLIVTKRLSRSQCICKLETTDIPSDDWFRCYAGCRCCGSAPQEALPLNGKTAWDDLHPTS